MAKIFLDTNVFKFSATKQLRMVPRRQEVDWGHITTTVVVHNLALLNPLDRLSAHSHELRSEADLLPKVAALGIREGVTFVTHMEGGLEAAHLPNMDSVSGKWGTNSDGQAVGVVDGDLCGRSLTRRCSARLCAAAEREIVRPTRRRWLASLPKLEI